MPASAPGPRADQAHLAQPALDPRILAAFRDATAVEVFGAVTGRSAPVPLAEIVELVGAERAAVEERLESLESWGLVERTSEGDDPAYRATREALITEAEWAQLAPEHRRQAFTWLLEAISARVWEGVESGGFDAPDAHVSRVPVDLDREGHEAVAQLGAELLERVGEIQAEVVQRRAEGTAEHDGIRSELVFLHYRRDGEPAPQDLAELREAAFDASEEVCDRLSEADPDWAALAARARELATLAERLSAASPAVHSH